MVQILPQNDPWATVGQQLGAGLSAGYMNRADEKAIQKAISDLGPNPKGRDLLNAIYGTSVYNPESRTSTVKNFLEVQQLEELERTHREQERIARDKMTAAKDKAEAERQQADLLIEQSKLSEKDKNALKGKVDLTTARGLITKPENVTEYEIAKNLGEGFQPEIKGYRERAVAAEEVLPIMETAIFNNENYTDTEKYWDTALDTINSSFLNQFKSKTGQQLEAITPISVASFGAKMPGVLTNARINLISKKAVNLGRDKDANRLFLYLDYYNRKADQLKAQFSNEILRDSPYGLPPGDFDTKLHDKLKPFRQMMGRDIDRMLNGQEPQEPISQLDFVGKLMSGAPEGKVPMTDGKGGYFYLREDQVGAYIKKHPESKRVNQ